MRRDLPRLAYVGDVPPRAISAGPALLYRLFECYPPEQLLICEDAANAPDPERQLANAVHVRYALVRNRWLRTRLSRWYGSWIHLHSAAAVPEITAHLRRFRAESVVGIAHGFGWWPAWLAARELHLPFHLIVHDHWRDFITLHPLFGRHARSRFRNVYRGASSRLVISPSMEKRYRREYGIAGTVIYPSRSRGLSGLGETPTRRKSGDAFTFAYAGGLASTWAKLAMVRLSHALEPLRARLRIHQSLELLELRTCGLRSDNVTIVPFQPVAELHRDLLANADAMFLPMSFAPADRPNVEVCFPSKLTDYTATKLPILINAPAYGTAVDWARRNGTCAEIVTDDDVATLQAAAKMLIDDPRRRERLGRAAWEAGERDFSPVGVFENFSRAIAGSENTAAALTR